MPEPAELIIHTDGASRGNPGAAAFSYVISRDGESDVEEAGCRQRSGCGAAASTASEVDAGGAAALQSRPVGTQTHPFRPVVKDAQCPHRPR